MESTSEVQLLSKGASVDRKIGAKAAEMRTSNGLWLNDDGTLTSGFFNFMLYL